MKKRKKKFVLNLITEIKHLTRIPSFVSRKTSDFKSEESKVTYHTKISPVRLTKFCQETKTILRVNDEYSYISPE